MGRKRLIRKQPLLDKIRSYPFDLLLSLNETRLSIDWDDYIPQTLPVGSAMEALFMILCKLDHYNRMASARRQNNVFRTDVNTYKSVVSRAIYGSDGTALPIVSDQGRSSPFKWILSFLLVTIFLISLVNAVNVTLRPYRNYTLLNTSTDYTKPKGSNVVKQNVSINEEKGIVDKVLAYFGEHSYYESDSASEIDTTYEATPVNKDVWVLKVWDPSAFQLYLFAAFSPVTLVILWLTSDVVFWKLLAGILAHNSVSFWLTSKFLLLIRDKQIIYQETFNEYNRKYVIPKTSVLKKNAVVDATYGPTASARMTVHDDVAGHLQNDFTFVTHDINGRRIKSVRGDLVASRAASPARESLRYADVLPQSRLRFGSIAELRERPSYIDDTESTQLGWITLSTPFIGRTGNESFLRHNDTFSRGDFSRGDFSRGDFSRGDLSRVDYSRNDGFTRPTSRPVSPSKTPSRFPYNQSLTQSHRTQFTPSRNYSSRPASPQRSPSPSKRRWH